MVYTARGSNDAAAQAAVLPRGAKMNSLMETYFPTFRMYVDLRKQLMGILDDDDLAFHPPGSNPSLGDLCRELGAVEVGYIDSFRTFKLDLASVASAGDGKTTLDELNKWFTDLDEELEMVVSGLTEDDLANRQIDRGGWSLPPAIQLDVYKEALLIFCGKVSVYLRSMGKTLPEQWQDWIG
jgi:hypothetical protein